jgi:Predicted tRNA(5-methylaminomethyl-2-thiouridylate) methyltransferase, contains the PP-loop ATPase domain
MSGGLDSILAAKLMLEQGVEVLAVNFSAKLCMCGCKKTGDSAAQTAAKMLGVPLKTIDITDDFIEIVKNPKHGHGANMNPCIDCKIYMFKHAKEMMAETGASFLVTGEVLGERPMSQRMDALHIIEKQAGVTGILLRPLTAKNLEPTIPELEGVVDREKLLDIRGRSRKPQMALAEKFGITKYPNPAGGCLLTDPGFAKRVKDAIMHGEFDADNLALLSVGRHFRLSPEARLVVGRDESENDIIESLAKPGDILFQLTDHQCPTSLLRGKIGAELIKLCAKIEAYHTKFRADESVKVDYWKALETKKEIVLVKPASKEEIESLRL